MPNFNRREFLLAACAGSMLALSACASTPKKPIARVVVIGGGFGGATAAKYIRLWEPRIEVVLVEPNRAFVSCPLSNLVLAGERTIESLTTNYDALGTRHGVRVVKDLAIAVDPDRREVRLSRGDVLSYDRLIVAPGIDFQYEGIPGLASAESRERVLHAWKAGAQTVALRKQLEAIPDGGVYALHIPKAPYRCPPGPYERASLVAFYFKQHKPRSKVLILDANPDITSKRGLFTAVWKERYADIIEYRPNSTLLDVDANALTAKLEFDSVKADVLNVVPPHRAGDIAKQAGLITANDKWCEVDWRTTESIAVKGIHVLGDATLSAPGMPKSGFMANNQGKLAADAVIALITGREVNPNPIIANTCYSFVSNTDVVHVASVHKFDAEKNTLVAVLGAGGLSSAPNDLEGKYAQAWGRNIWADALL